MTATPDQEKLFLQSDEYFEDLLMSLDQAKKEILFESYIYEEDEVGQAFDRTLMRAAQRGVKIQLLVDGIGSQNWIRKKKEELRQSGVQVRVFHPLFFSHFLDDTSKSIGLFSGLLRLNLAFAHLNNRNHRKMILIDRKIVFTGSLNISANHSRMVNHQEAWVDLGLKFVHPPEIENLVRGHQRAWTKSSYSLSELKTDLLSRVIQLRDRKTVQIKQFLLNDTLLKRRWAGKLFRTELRRARNTIWLANPYIAPARSTLRELKRAALRGVDVRIVTSSKSDVFFMPWVASAYYRELIESGVRIYEEPRHFIHAKCMILDELHIVGSSNLNQRSLRHDLEIDALIVEQKNQDELKCFFENLFKTASRIHETETRLKSFLGRFFLFFVKYWI
jgi:cardiolipin synthase